MNPAEMDDTGLQKDLSAKFWEKPLAELNGQEWEHLCDGCGRCCLKKFSDTGSSDTNSSNIESEAIIYTRIVCQYYAEDINRCSCYEERTTLVPDCLNVQCMNLESVSWMPDTCAYRLRFEDKPLYNWHPLLAGTREKMIAEGITISGKVVSEEHVHPEGFEEHIIRWVSA